MRKHYLGLSLCSFRCYRNSVEFPFGSPRLISGTRPSLERSDRQVEGVEKMLPPKWGSAISQPPRSGASPLMRDDGASSPTRQAWETQERTSPLMRDDGASSPTRGIGARGLDGILRRDHLALEHHPLASARNHYPGGTATWIMRCC